VTLLIPVSRDASPVLIRLSPLSLTASAVRSSIWEAMRTMTTRLTRAIAAEERRQRRGTRRELRRRRRELHRRANLR
jgi:hypothetical protein